MDKIALKIRRADGKLIDFEVELPKTDEEYSTGLAYRKSLPERNGLLYSYNNIYYFGGYPYRVGMYTPQTEIPVDFIFCDNAGTIIKIHRNAKPLSEDLIRCYCVGSVLEINGGECEKFNINVGDFVLVDPNLEEEILKPLKIKNGEYSKIYNEIYCKNKKNGTSYTYSYKSNRWLEITEDAQEMIDNRIKHLKTFLKEEIIDEKEANFIAIDSNKKILEDLKNTQRRYYWYSKNLFLEFNYEINVLKYYDFIKKEWVAKEWQVNFVEPFLDMKEKALIMTSNDVFEQIHNMVAINNKNELKSINKENLDILKGIVDPRYPQSCILYKTKNQPGWYMTDMDGSVNHCLYTCRKNVKSRKWTDFKIYSSYVYSSKFDTWGDKHKSFISFEELYDNSLLLYMPSEKKYYLPKEEINYPKKDAKIALDFKIETIYNPKNEDLLNPEEYYEPTTEANIVISANGKSSNILTIVENNLKELKMFIKDLKEKDCSSFSNNDWTNAKLIAWDKGNNVRFMLQYYYHSIRTQIDVLIEKTTFYNEFENAIKKLAKMKRYTTKEWNKNNKVDE